MKSDSTEADEAAVSAPFLSGYHPLPGIYDEAVDERGTVRPHWTEFLGHMQRLGSTEVKRRWQRAQRQIAIDDVTFNPHDSAGEVARPWKLDAIPLIIDQQQWAEIATGLEQRALLMDRILADLFGAQTLLKERLLPPEVLFGHPGFHPSYLGLKPANGRFLQFYAADLIRASDGRWWSTGDRTRAPFGPGYVLENRIVTSRTLPLAFRQCHVQRLAPFFVTLRQTLRAMAPRFKDNPRIVLWTKGPTSQSYFEDAYLARYLGYTLAEGGDLAVRENRVMLKTLSGLLPVEVLFRRLDDNDCDPVELTADSRTGVSGLLEVMRSGNVSVANALGSRLVESPILLPFLRNICRHLLDADLLTPSIATWWLGQKSARDYALEHFDELLIRPAYRMENKLPFDPRNLTKDARQTLFEKVRARPELYVAQERVVGSTSPVWTLQGAQPWPMAMRVFLVADEHEFQTMPGGLARVSSQGNLIEHDTTAGERSQDVWVLSATPVDQVSLLDPPGATVTLRRGGDELPSRVADNMFWLGRYAERAEASARLLRTTLQLITSESAVAAAMPALVRALAESGQIEPDYAIAELNASLPDIEGVLPEAIFDTKLPRSLRSTINEAVRLASVVRDRIAIDAWRILHGLDLTARRPEQKFALDASDVLDILDAITTELVAFAGLASESMTRTQGWRFLDLGRRVERAYQSSSTLRAMLADVREDESSVLEAVLLTQDSLMTYRSRYLANLQPAAVLDLLITDETNPRAIIYQLAKIVNHVDRLPRAEYQASLGPEQRLAIAIHNAVRLSDVVELAEFDSDRFRVALDRLLLRLADQLPKLSDAVSGRFLIHAGLPRHFGTF